MDHSPFNMISAELRNQIYELVLVHADPIIITADSYDADIRSTSFLHNSHPLALLHTCRRIHNESTALFYGNNKFHFKFATESPSEDKDELCLVQRFLASIGETASLGLRDVHVDVDRIFDRQPGRRSPSIIPWNVYGLQGISVLNDALKIKYTITTGTRWSREQQEIPQVTTSLQIEDLNYTLAAAIELLEASKLPHSATNYQPIDASDMLNDLRYLQKTITGPE